VYESLARLHVRRGEPERAFLAIERGKSRSMAEMLALPELLSPDPEFEQLRQDLNWHYRQIEIAALSQQAGLSDQMPGYIKLLRERAKEREQEIGRRFTALRSGGGGLRTTTPEVGLDEIRASIPAGSLLIEYYEIRGIFYACLLGAANGGSPLEILPVARSSQVRGILRLLQFQISKFRLGGPYLRHFAAANRSAAESHLRELYEELIAPIAPRLAGHSRLIVVPHGVLHDLPFHALFDGRRFLADDFAVSKVLRQCLHRRAKLGICFQYIHIHRRSSRYYWNPYVEKVGSLFLNNDNPSRNCRRFHVP